MENLALRMRARQGHRIVAVRARLSLSAAASHVKLIDEIGAEEPLVGDRAIAIVDYDFRRLVGLGQPNRFRDRILAAGKVRSWMIFPLFC